MATGRMAHTHPFPFHLDVDHGQNTNLVENIQHQHVVQEIGPHACTQLPAYWPC